MAQAPPSYEAGAIAPALCTQTPRSWGVLDRACVYRTRISGQGCASRLYKLPGCRGLGGVCSQGWGVLGGAGWGLEGVGLGLAGAGRGLHGGSRSAGLAPSEAGSTLEPQRLVAHRPPDVRTDMVCSLGEGSTATPASGLGEESGAPTRGGSRRGQSSRAVSLRPCSR